MGETGILLVVAAVGAAILLALLLWKPRRPAATESFKTFKSTYPELIGRKVAVVRSIPPKSRRDPATVYVKVDANNVVIEDPKLPWIKQPAPQVVAAFSEKFGAKNVRASTRNKRRKNKVTVVHDGSTNEVIKVYVPRQWAMPPPFLDLVGDTFASKIAVAVNPTSRVTRKTLVLATAGDGRVTSATVQG